MKTQFQSNFASQSRLMQCSLRRSRADARSGFTVIELIVVVMVIAILAAMLLPAINGARNTARNAQVTVDIKNLEAAIATFRQKFGREPPSSFVLYENGNGWTNPPSSLAQKTRESIATIREIWPEFDFTYGNTPSNPIGVNPNPNSDFPALGQLDINGNGQIDSDPIVLNGAECITFFLGGVCATLTESDIAIYDQDGKWDPEEKNISRPALPQKWGPIGFSSNPRFPFKRTSQNRVGPFFEFATARLKADTKANTITSPGIMLGGTMPACLDPLPNQTLPYLYISSYGGRGYPFKLPAAGIDSGNPDFSPLNFVTYYRPGSKIPHNNKSYQIISPGRDQEYGVGGFYESGKQLPSDRASERDNITNFSGGPLQP